MDLSQLNLKNLMILPVLMLLASILVIGVHYRAGTIPMSVEMKGGTLITAYGVQEGPAMERDLKERFGFGVQVTAIKDLSGETTGANIQIDKFLKGEESEEVKNFLLGRGIKAEGISLRSVGPSLSKAFLEQAVKAVLFAFLFMAVVIFFRFKTLVPSFAVVLSAFSDITTTLAVMILLGLELSSGSLVALLLLIGYSVDTDILLTTRLLAKKGGNINEKVLSAMKTGLTMNSTTIVAVGILFLVSTSSILKEIASVILIGMVADAINTWIQNAGILQMYLERA